MSFTGEARSVTHRDRTEGLREAGGLALGFLFVAIWLRTAWVCDDAFITLRHIDHLLRGYGPVFNVGERVIGFTHPLWFLLLVPIWAATKSAATTFFVASAAASAAALWVLLWRLVASWPAVLLAGTALLASRSFVDWSSSGLENPLAHLLVALLALEALGRARLGHLAGLGALLGLTRPELLLLAFPPLVLAWWRSEDRLARRIRSVTLGLAPLALWHAGSLFWSGSLLPNTALAKLPPNLALGETLQQGLLYLLSSVLWDPPTLLVVALGLASTGRHPRRLALALGGVLVLLAIVRVGGDFMNGRFLTPIFVLAVALIATSRWAGNARAVGALAGVVLLAGSQSSHLLHGPWRPSGEQLLDLRGVTDERLWYARSTSLSLVSTAAPLPLHGLVDAVSAQWDGQSRIAVAGAIGVLAWTAGSSIHVVDRHGLTDPFLARLPFARGAETWRTGHLARRLPEGYLASLEQGQNLVGDPCLQALYADVLAATRGPLLAGGRVLALTRLQIHDRLGMARAYGSACADTVEHLGSAVNPRPPPREEPPRNPE